MTLPYLSVFKIIMEGRSASKFMLGAIASFGFSIAVILCTIGLMDGFENTLKESLSKSSGDLTLYKGDSFFFLDNSLKQNLNYLDFSPLIDSEGFLLSQNTSKGVLIKGVDPDSFSKVTGLKINAKMGEINLGKELFKHLDLSIDDKVTLAFATNSERNQGAPILQEFVVKGIVEHGIYEKDLRIVYLNDFDLRSILKLKADVYNSVSLKLKGPSNSQKISNEAEKLENKLLNFRVVPYWKEFQTLLDAVEVEKFSISLVLQLIVVVAIFNVIAFIIFISERKSQEFFLLRALGLNLRSVMKFWIYTVMGIWFVSCLMSIVLAKFFNYLLMHMSFLKLPGDIYVLSNLSLNLGNEDYFLVFGLSFIWMMLITLFALLRLKKKSLIYGLRQEFA